MFDVFYIGIKPGLFPHEKPITDIEQACAQSRTRFFWVTNYLCDYTGWDWLWEPSPWQAHQRHAWCSQWQKDSGTYLVPRSGFQDTNYHCENMIFRKASTDFWVGFSDENTESFDFSWHPDPTDPPYIYQFGTQWQKTGGPRYVIPDAIETKYVDQIRIDVKVSDAPAIVIDHLDGNVEKVVEQISHETIVLRQTRFVDNYLDTLRRIVNSTDHDGYLWICSSVCDYANFDFTWHPEQWQSLMLHVFPSNDQKFGDTFFMHVPSFRNRSQHIELLDWYDINFVDVQSVPRRPMPVIQHSEDSHVDIIKQSKSRAPLTLYTVADVPASVPAVNLWRNEVRTVIPLDPGASRVIVPREAQPLIQQQVYDYAIIDKTHRSRHSCEPLDIVFISNGEPNADQNWGALLHRKQGRPNRCVRVDGVNGRAAAYHAAAAVSETPWFFAVFAKLEVLDDFDWSWQPDRLQQPKHYIFHALNPVNMLEYGHQAMIAYNKKITLANPGRGLDFTLDDAHEVVPVLSGVARYNVDPWTTWRTAFREVIKLRASMPDVENEYRMSKWLTVGNGPHGEFSCHGAQDALNFYDEVSGNPVQLRQSYEWSWLSSYALLVRPELFAPAST